MSTILAANPLKEFRSPRTVIGRFVARHTVRGAAAWALVFGLYVASKAIGFADLYPTVAARQKIAETFSSNVGIELILGKAPHLATTAAYVAWNTSNVIVIIGAVWALLLATRYFRGEEDSGRQEILLSGQTTARTAAVNILSGLIISLITFYIVLAGLLVMVGKAHGVDFNTIAALYFTLVVTLGIGLFMVLGALASQLMPTRGRAATVCVAILGICFLARAIGDITSLHWLLDLSPLGWVEKLQPLAHSQPLWLLPFAGLIIILMLLSIFFAGKRDLGESVFADKSSVKPHLGLLNSPLGAAVRLSRANSLGWLSGIFIVAILYGVITKSTAQAFSQSPSFQKAINRLAEQQRLSGALAFLGIVFFLQMIIIMCLAASQITAIRRDEANGYLDNYLVGPISRLRWLVGRLSLLLSVLLAAGILTIFGVWLGIISQHLGLTLRSLAMAGVNALVPAFITLSVGVLAFGLQPRLTSFLAYGVLAWSFLIEMLSSGIKINHWLLDSSIFNQVALAPAGDPKWATNGVLLVIGLICCLAGALAFNRRDLQTE